jgi:hypothetical protein
MDKENLLKQIEQEFRHVTLGDNYTLAEEDYADTSYWHFDRPHPNSNLTEDEWAKQEIRFFETCGWLSADQEEAIHAIKQKRKMRNRFENPLNIPVLYLNMHFTGFSYLDSQAYLFYTPAIMINYLSDPDTLYNNSFTWWLSRLKRAESREKIMDLLKYFSEIQIEVLEEFLFYVSELSAENQEVKKALDNLKLISKM